MVNLHKRLRKKAPRAPTDAGFSDLIVFIYMLFVSSAFLLAFFLFSTSLNVYFSLEGSAKDAAKDYSRYRNAAQARDVAMNTFYKTINLPSSVLSVNKNNISITEKQGSYSRYVEVVIPATYDFSARFRNTPFEKIFSNGAKINMQVKATYPIESVSRQQKVFW
ncbi:MAG: hypothetical protein KM296_00125 [Brockia lithotrophica]|nr:hypothetical protein [Brockia lithotrophica]